MKVQYLYNTACKPGAQLSIFSLEDIFKYVKSWLKFERLFSEFLEVTKNWHLNLVFVVENLLLFCKFGFESGGNMLTLNILFLFKWRLSQKII